MFDGVRLAVGTLSVLPVGAPGTVDRRVAGQAMALAPVVGAVIGGLSAAVVALVQYVKPEAELLAAVLGVVVLVTLSGALHLDGLADFADALGSRRDRETMLRIMKQSDIGPFGVVAIVAVLLVDVAALATCVRSGFGWQAVLIAAVASRLTLPWSCRTTIPTARPDGLGAFVASTVRTRTAALTTILALATCTTLAALTTLRSTATAESPPETVGAAPGLLLAGAAIAVLVAVGIGTAVVRQARRTIGGITGDVLGAAIELAFPAALLTLAITS